ncbi:hypothetical protein C8E00_104339 [Chromohalobacter marismortui]|uniref:YecA family protein n=1 Tax=Chromohalobacter marismortui TaxID=42055 RepID=A0A4R7NNM0_9GAMM|nr:MULTISPECIES: UPF0149 family protein [Chromohalobacter]MCI0509941.1 UPF0149 family protein [Chromohalobacter sp.]MCI0593127.1 UPF0149 family protein [Chromohalobacter sp.]TDU22159.1 hypothetical protein C8E00_104339 [Chromohalobacter marismortui]
MSLIDEQLDFSRVADTFLAHGSLQSPAFLDGRLCARLALADIGADTWLEEVCASLGVEQPNSREDGEVLLAWRRQALDALAAPELNFEPLLPDDLFSLAERAHGLQEWTQGFLEAIVEAGGQSDDWSPALREVLEDLGSLVNLEIELEDNAENENDLFALTEHARMAAMLLYTEQHPGEPQVERVENADSDDGTTPPSQLH